MPSGASEGTTVAGFPVSDAFAMGPVLSPDGTHVVAGRWGMDGPAWFIGAIDGTTLAKLKDVDSQTWHEPAWSPSGAQIAFVKNSSNGPVLAVASKDGSGVKNIGPLPLQHADAGADSAFLSWSGDGKYIAVTQTEPSGELADSRVTIFEVANGNSTLIAKAGSASFSPKGATLAYVTLDAKGKPALVSRSAAGKVTTLRTIGGLTWAAWASPTLWSPDASRIAYLADWTHDIEAGWHSIRSGGGGEVKLTGTYVSPRGSWAPDSRHFAAGGYDRVAVVVGADGSAPVKLDVDALRISWAGPGVVVASGTDRIDAYDLTSGRYAATEFLAATSSGYVIGGGNIGVLVVVSVDSGEGTVSIHKP
jgi:Tol biopolymer transport system component